jgi:hypothetical protein
MRRFDAFDVGELKAMFDIGTYGGQPALPDGREAQGREIRGRRGSSGANCGPPTPPLACAKPRCMSPPLQCSNVGRPVHARGIPFVLAGAEGRLGRAAARGAHFVLMSPWWRNLVGASVAACNVVRARRPLLLCRCQCFGVKLGSSGRDAPPGTHVPRYGAREVV